jgi:hypothetical protein
MRTGIATVPLDYGHCPRWLFERMKRLGKIILFANSENPENFEKLLSLKGIGPKTIRALSLVSEIIYGSKPSYEDPARYSFSVGGKDGTPYPVDRETYDQTLGIIEKGIQKNQITIKEKVEDQRRLKKNSAELNMGTITPKISRYWPKRNIEFLKNNWKLNNDEIGRRINKQYKAVSDKRRALGLPLRECDAVPLTYLQKQLIYGSLLGDGSVVKGKEDKN